MTIKQLLEMPTGKENRTGGFQLVIKKAGKITVVKNKYLQSVIFIDETGEIPADVSLPKFIPLQRNQKIHITVCWSQPAKNGNKLYVEQFYPVTITEEELGFKYQPDWGPEDSEAMEWAEARREEVKGKCRYGVVCAFISAGTKLEGPWKDIVNKLVEFIVTGE